MADIHTESADNNSDKQPSGWLASCKSILHWSKLVNLRTISVLLFLSVLVNMAVFFSSGEEEVQSSKRELSLGEFRFVPSPGEVTSVERADFKLHISLLSEVEPMTRQRLESHQFRVQQNIEELLRQAHGGDFDDPSLAELKRQLQERINDTISVRGIADVIITDLRLQRHDRSLGVDGEESVTERTIPGFDAADLDEVVSAVGPR